MWHQAAQGKFADIAEAYEILSDGTTRQLYDHARRVRATHDASVNDGRGGAPEAGDWAAAEGDWFYYHDGPIDGGIGGLFGSSFDGGGGFDFGDRVTFGAGSGSGGGGLSGRGAFEFRASDPIELFEVRPSSFDIISSRNRWREISEERV